MLKSFLKFLKYLEQWEKYEPSSFWLCTIGLWFTIKSFSFAFGALSPVSEVPSQSQVVVVELRAGGSSEKIGIVQKFAAFFLRKSNPRPRQCPDPNLGPRFAPGSGFNSPNSPWGNSDPDPCQQAAAPPRNQWNSDEEFYRYDANQDKKNDKQEDQTPIEGECRPRVLLSRINEDEGLINAAEKACKNRQYVIDQAKKVFPKNKK